MKLELTYTKEADGNWYKIKQNGYLKQCFKVQYDESNKDEVLERAKLEYYRIKQLEMGNLLDQEVIVLSEEIPKEIPEQTAADRLKLIAKALDL